MTCKEALKKILDAYKNCTFQNWTRAERAVVGRHISSCKACLRKIMKVAEADLSGRNPEVIAAAAARVEDLIVGDLADPEYREVAGEETCAIQAENVIRRIV